MRQGVGGVHEQGVSFSLPRVKLEKGEMIHSLHKGSLSLLFQLPKSSQDDRWWQPSDSQERNGEGEGQTIDSESW
jgi:hypothetical protein